MFVRKAIVALVVIFPLFASRGMCEEYSHSYKDETIFENTIWSGKVLIEGAVTLFTEASLTIEPGTVVAFKKVDTNNDGIGEGEVFVQGELIAKGTKERPIIFTSAENEKKPGDWVAINMMSSEDKKNTLSNCIVEYSYRGFHAHFSTMDISDCEMRNNYLAVQFQDSIVAIRDCNIHNNNQGIQFRDSKLKMSNTKISDNKVGIRCVYSDVEFSRDKIYGSSMTGFQTRGGTVSIVDSNVENNRAGVTAQDSKVTISGSTILNNMEDGVALHNSQGTITQNIIMMNGDDGIYLENSAIAINYNNIFNNAKYNLRIEQAADVDAKNNFWGTDDIDKVHLFNYDKKDLDSLGEINVQGYSKAEMRLKVGSPFYLPSSHIVVE